MMNRSAVRLAALAVLLVPAAGLSASTVLARQDKADDPPTAAPAKSDNSEVQRQSNAATRAKLLAAASQLDSFIAERRAFMNDFAALLASEDGKRLASLSDADLRPVLSTWLGARHLSLSGSSSEDAAIEQARSLKLEIAAALGEWDIPAVQNGTEAFSDGAEEVTVAVGGFIVAQRALLMGDRMPVEALMKKAARRDPSDATLEQRLRGMVEAKISAVSAGRVAAFEESMDNAALHARKAEQELVFKEQVAALNARLEERNRELQLLEFENNAKVQRLEDELASLRQDLGVERERAAQHREMDFESDMRALKAEYERAQQTWRERETELRRELAAREDELAKVRGRLTLRELPPDVKARVRILAAPGIWKPQFRKPSHLEGHESVARYPQEQAHSLSALAAVGALDEGPQGIYALYAVLVAKGDTKRPRFNEVFRIHNDPTQTFWVDLTLNEMRTEFDQTPERKREYERLVAIQTALREYGDEFVQSGVLEP